MPLPRDARTTPPAGPPAGPPAAPPAAPIGAALQRALPLAAVVAAALAAWWGSWNGAFVFDDHPAIDQNAALLAGDWWNAAFGPLHSPLSNRPLACLSVAIDFALFGPGPFGPHLTNVLLHALNGALLLAVLRRALRAPNLAHRFTGGGANAFALAVAVIWTVHPLCGDAVCYATQRSTLLFSGLLLACLCATLRANASPRHRVAWQGAAAAAMALGMASKEDMVTAPVLVLLLQRAFVLPSWRALRERAGFHAALAATCGVLVACVALGPHNETVGYATVPRVTAVEWLLTQAGVVVHYVRLAAWPSPLRGAYDDGIVRSFGPAVLPGLLALALVVLAVLAWRRRPWLGFLGAMFFLLLAPTSTVMPIVTEVVAERRVYLPMLFVIVPLAAAARTALLRGPAFVAPIAIAAVVLVLAFAAHERVAVHATEAAFWQDAFDKRDPDSRSHLAAQILSNHAAMVMTRGDSETACRLFDVAMECDQPTVIERTHHAVSLQERGRHAEAIAELERVIREAPQLAEPHAALGTCLLKEAQVRPGPADAERLKRAESALRRALELEPARGGSWNSLGWVLSRRGDWAGAERAYERAIELESERVEPLLNRADALAKLGRAGEIQPMLERALAARPADVPLRVALAQGVYQRGNLELVKMLLRDVLRLDPDHAQAAAALRELEAKTPR